MSHLKTLTRQSCVVNCKNRDMRWEKLNIPNYKPTYISSGFLKICVNVTKKQSYISTLMVFLLMKSLVLERIHPPIPIQWNSYERHWALTKVIIEITIFWAMISCNLVDMYGCFRL
jgi:hypothetical protein